MTNTRYYPRKVWIDTEAQFIEAFSTPLLDSYMTSYKTAWSYLNSPFIQADMPEAPTEMEYELKSQNTHQHQFRMAHLSLSNQAPIRKWCMQQFGSQGHGRRWRLVGRDEYHFMFDKDSMAFKLRFGGLTNQDFDDELE